MDPGTVWLMRLVAKIGSSEGGRQALFWLVGGLLAAGFSLVLLVAMASGVQANLAGGGAGVAPSVLLGLWAPLVATDAAAAGIPPVLELGLIAHESGGVWMATHSNNNGTTDAGLGQVNSANWAAYGLAKDPYDPARNVAVSVRILAGDLAANPGHVAAALEAYNAGSALRGWLFDPQYAGDVLAQVQGMEAGPVLGAWPLGGTKARGGLWQAPMLPAAGQVTWVVTAFAPYGTKQVYDGRTWPALVPPASLAGSAPLQPCAGAPVSLAKLLPPHAACWYATVPAAPGQVLSLQLNAIWYRTGTVDVPVPGHPHQTQQRQESAQVGVPKTVTATVISGRKTA